MKADKGGRLKLIRSVCDSKLTAESSGSNGWTICSGFVASSTASCRDICACMISSRDGRLSSVVLCPSELTSPVNAGVAALLHLEEDSDGAAYGSEVSSMLPKLKTRGLVGGLGKCMRLSRMSCLSLRDGRLSLRLCTDTTASLRGADASWKASDTSLDDGELLSESIEDSDCTVLAEGDLAILTCASLALVDAGESRLIDTGWFIGEGVKPRANLSGVGKRGIEEAEPASKNRWRGGEVGVGAEELMAAGVAAARGDGDAALAAGEATAAAETLLGKFGEESVKGERRNCCSKADCNIYVSTALLAIVAIHTAASDSSGMQNSGKGMTVGELAVALR